MTFVEILASIYADARRRYLEALKTDRDTRPFLRQIEALEAQFADKLVLTLERHRRG